MATEPLLELIDYQQELSPGRQHPTLAGQVERLGESVCTGKRGQPTRETNQQPFGQIVGPRVDYDHENLLA
jgi:hypothetical protein